MADSGLARLELQEMAQRVLREFSRRGLVELGDPDSWKTLEEANGAPRVAEAGKLLELDAAIHIAYEPADNEPEDSEAVEVTKDGDRVTTILLRPYRSELALLRGFADVLEDLGIDLPE